MITLSTPEIAPLRTMTSSAAQSHYYPKQPPVSALLHRFDPINLEQMNDVALLSRIDTKYLIPVKHLPRLLLELSSHYLVFETERTRLHPYRTLYFDTPDFTLYQRHHAGGRNRYKVRSRAYLNSNLAFLEVKFKTNKKQTIKNRVRTSTFTTHLTPETYPFLADHCPLDPTQLEPNLYNDYSRITLVSKTRPERLTLDLDLQFWNESDHGEVPGIVIAELKQEVQRHASPLTQMMREFHLRDGSFSKYAMGVTLLYPHLKQNRFKEEHRRLAKLQEGAVRDYL